MPYFEPREYDFVIALGGGPFYSPKMGRKFSNGYVSVEFFDDNPEENLAANIVTPGAGELTMTLTESDNSALGSYGSIPNGVVSVATAYDRPNWGGGAQFLKVEETVGVTTATHARVKILRT